MRVIAGKAGSLPLKAPAGRETRPTTDRIKETLFNMLNPYLPGSVFLDLFSGSGGIGIEALSRGARKAYFVEKDKRALQCIRDNLRFTRLEAQGVVLARDARDCFSQIREPFVHIVFMDPPYHMGAEREILAKLSGVSFVTKDTLIVTEASLETDLSGLEGLGFSVVREKSYKTNKHVFIKRRVANEGGDLSGKF